jgi:hypothetical protein
MRLGGRGEAARDYWNLSPYSMIIILAIFCRNLCRLVCVTKDEPIGSC